MPSCKENNMTNDTTTILISGIGGQGIVLASDLLAIAAMKSGYDVKVSEIHGMAQRSGSVSTSVRFGKNVDTMITDEGSADMLLSFETTEALRNLSCMKQGATLIVNDNTYKPVCALTGKVPMPQNPQATIKALGGTVLSAKALAIQSGVSKASNVVLLGYLSNFLPFSMEVWKEAIEQRVPAKFIEGNIRAFELGRAYRA